MAGRRILKLTIGKKAAQPSQPSQSAPQPSQKSPTPPRPSASSTPAPAPKLKLKLGLKLPVQKPEQKPTPAKPKKPAKTSKETPTSSSSKKRPRDTAADTNGKASRGAAAAEGAPVKRFKLTTKPKQPTALRIKNKGAPPVRPRGAGYDSEASDTEIDPALEEEFILRMEPGEDCEYLRKAIEEKRFGPRALGGADVSFKSLTRDGRRAIVTIRGNIYAAALVDLPAIIEGLKSWDKRGWYKAADICQMLLVLGKVKTEEEAHSYPLPKDVDPATFQYAHGLTPPLRWVRKRRFRKRISNRTIEAVELEVARLLKEDLAAIKPPDFEIMDQNQYARESQGEQDGFEEYDDEQDAEGEFFDESLQYEEQQYEEPLEMDDDLAAEMEAELAAHADAGSVPASATPDVSHTGDDIQEPDTESYLDVGTPQTPQTPLQAQAESSGDEDESGMSAAEDANDDLDEDALEQQHQLQEQLEEIAELEADVEAETRRWEGMNNPILKNKLGKRVQNLRQALELKKVSLGGRG
ncbi:transcription initiation factor TFIID subunit 7 [Nannizzia gypsea CBS 118893]|uniref:Transcription initiation factor TFIID subunit 7 n=1 Tax=Arthroderma gypseum (strain ATCC MYA-4604 / CBS 118893) TaxID=535722 RepID=E4UVI7_ARTGP|nr:transcription initiation factor TFIID subunit 7 [Nannizzia gypsea CBS 118893]EFR02314.1 transcription initiation factor TFIID subunit 7 [Nannizzia gypsea CBS 118893]